MIIQISVRIYYKLFLLLLTFGIISFAPSGIYPIEDFSQPLEDTWRGRFKNFKEVYKIHDEQGNKFLQASSTESANFIIRKVDVNIVEYPFFNWRWRANKLPVGGDESVKQHCDVSASIALVLSKSRVFPKSIKYSWSTTLPEETYTKSPFAIWPARCDIHVMQSGDTDISQWVTEKVNVLDDYKRFYNKEKVKSKKIRAIVILTDSDNTGSPSKADYDDFYFSKE